MPKSPITCADHMGVPRHAQDRPVQVWILGHGVDQALLERAETPAALPTSSTLPSVLW